MPDKGIKISERTFEALTALKEFRGSTHDRVIRDMLEYFAPLLASTVYGQDEQNREYIGDKKKVVAFNKKQGSQEAYRAFFRRMEDDS